MSKIQEAFPTQGRELFESEKPIVEDFNNRYRGRIKDRFQGTGRRLSEQELADVRAMEAKYGKRHVEWPFPNSGSRERRFDPCDVRVLNERRAVVEYLRKYGMTDTADAIEQGKHLDL